MEIVLKANKDTCDIVGWQSNTGEVNARTLTVELSEEMNECAMAFVTFELKDGTVYESLVINGKANIPTIKEPQFIKIGVYSADVEEEKVVKRYSPHPTDVYVNMGSYSGNGAEPPIITPTDYEKLVELIKNIGGGVTVLNVDDVLQALNDRTDNEPQKVYSANTLNQYIIAPVLQRFDRIDTKIGKKEETSNKVTEIDAEVVNDTQYPTTKAVFDFGIRIIESHQEQVDTQMNELEERLTAYIGGIENGSY